MILNFLISFFPSKQLYKQVFRRVETSDSSAICGSGSGRPWPSRTFVEVHEVPGFGEVKVFPIVSPFFQWELANLHEESKGPGHVFYLFSILFLSFSIFCIWCVGPLQASPTDLPLIEVKENDLSPSLGSPEVWNQSDGIWLTSLCIRINFSYRRVALLPAWCSNRPSTEATSLQGRE